MVKREKCVRARSNVSPGPLGSDPFAEAWQLRAF